MSTESNAARIYSFAYFATTPGGGFTFGSLPIQSRKPITSPDDLDRAAAFIRRKRPDLTSVAVLSWQRFEDTAGEATGTVKA